MLVDDRSENLKSLTQLLDRPDLEILTASSGNEALGMMLDHDLALVLLDVQMPEMDGFEVAELMRRNIRTQHIPIIFVTAINKDRRHIFSGYEAGAVDYIFKPVDPFIIRSKVNVFLEIKRNHLAREKLVADLNQANNRLREISTRKSDFLSAASHELRTPLTVIKEYTSLVLEEVVGSLNEEQKSCLGSALRNCNRLAGLVDDLLDLDKIESGHSQIQRGPLDLAKIAKDLQEDFAEKCRSGEQTLTLEFAEDLPVVLGDSGLINQVFFNLIGNACKFTPAGGMITVKTFARGSSVRFEVSDTGPGISPQDQIRVFEKFTQLDRRDGPGAQGTGLGLPISHKIMELHGEKLGLKSEEGVGATFSFQLPVYDLERHISAFVLDGVHQVGDDQEDWTLIYLRPGNDGTVLPIGLAQEIDRLFRSGKDRTASLSCLSEPWQMVLLQTGIQGCASFLERLEKRLANQKREEAILAYAVVKQCAGAGYPLVTDIPQLNFQPLGLALEQVGGGM